MSPVDDPLLVFISQTLGTPLLALDAGTKTIGLARSDPGWTLAVPLRTLQRTKFSQDSEALRRIVEQENIGGVVIGLPLSMDGSEGSRAQSCRALARNLGKEGFPPSLLWDERLSTADAAERLYQAGVPGRKHKEQIDSIAAQIILEDALKALALCVSRSFSQNQ